MKHEITRTDIMPMEEYARIRADKRREMRPIKDRRRVAIGPDATFYFESYETMWHQVHEMLFIERGGEEQIADELSAYNPLIPKGGELVATVMFEIDNPDRRARVLGQLGGVEEMMTLEVGGDVITGVAEEDVDRTSAAGKASSVQFVHFPVTDAQKTAFKTPGTRVVLSITHPAYQHAAVIPEAVRAELAKDLD
ncbi:MAG: DUF3501 family protein [Rhodospirillaceae bacterium]|nr:DUF3501 family protein [Rhodospirillaceae bacterium]